MAITSVNNRELLFRKSKSKGSGVKDWISKLPDELLCKILSSLTTKDSTRTSVLSKRWRNLWTSVPALDLNTNKFEDDCDFWEFFDSFLESNVELGLNRFKLIYNVGEHFHSDFASRIDDVVKRRVCCLTVVNRVDGEEALVRMPLSLYSCATLVNLELHCVFFDAPKSALVSLPSLKSMTLKAVKFDGNELLEILISSCSVLEELVIVTHLGDNLEVICVRSQSLNSFELESTRGDYCDVDEHPGDPHLVIDAPRLEYMSVRDYQTDRLIIINIGPSAKVQLDFIFDVEYDDPSERTMMSNFLTAISTVDVMSISARTLEMINDFRELDPLPQFVNLSCLHAFSLDYSWEALQTFLGFCPNLQSLNVDFECLPEPETINLSYVPQCFLSSLEFVELRTLVEASEKKLATYFLRNCVVLKKLMLTESFGNIMKKIKGIPKRSRECEVVMLESDDDSD